MRARVVSTASLAVVAVACRVNFDTVAVEADAAPRLAGWAHRQPLAVRSLPADAVTSFPMLVDVVDPSIVGHVRGDGADLRFTSGDGRTVLPHELAAFDPASGRVRAWVGVPALEATFYMYFDNPAATPVASEPTWAEFAAVWHLDGDPTTSVLDAGANANVGMPLGTWSSAQSTVGQIGSALRFSAAMGDHVRVEDSPSLDLGDLTIEAWVRTTQAAQPGMFPGIVSKEDSVDPRQGYNLVLHQATADARWYFETFEAGVSDEAHGTSDVADGAWHYIVGTKTGPTLRAYQDAQLGEVVSTTTMNLSHAIPLELGTLVSVAQFYDGTLDEVRISRTARSPSWISAAYANYTAPASFFEPLGPAD